MAEVPECIICFDKLSLDREGLGISSTICSHAFHKSCLDRSFEAAGHKKCPKCRTDLDGQDAVLPLLLEFSHQECESRECVKKRQKLIREKKKLQEDLDHCVSALESLTLTPTPAPADIPYGSHGSRAHLGVFLDSTCLNCESTSHITRQCPMPPIIRTTGATTFKDWAPERQYEMLFRVRGEYAGEHLAYFEDNQLSGPITHRRQLQMLWAFTFFDKGCLTCGSPYHQRPECQEGDEPDFKNFARFLHFMNHPEKRVIRRQKSASYLAYKASAGK